jgi:hypothetical protein
MTESTRQKMKPPTTPGTVSDPIVVATALDELATFATGHHIQLKSCAALERIIVRTRNSVYEVIVLSGDTGEVMVRGGRFLAEFQRAKVAGSTFGGRAVKLRTICVGLRLEFLINRKSVVTSRIQAVSRRRIAVADGRA